MAEILNLSFTPKQQRLPLYLNQQQVYPLLRCIHYSKRVAKTLEITKKYVT